MEQIHFDRFDDDQVDVDPNVDADAYDDDSFQITQRINDILFRISCNSIKDLITSIHRNKKLL